MLFIQNSLKAFQIISDFTHYGRYWKIQVAITHLAIGIDCQFTRHVVAIE